MYILDDPYASYKLLRDELAHLGYVAKEFTSNDHRYISFTSSDGKSWVTPAARIAYPMMSSAFADISLNKEKGYDFAKKIGLNIPTTYLIDEQHDLDAEELRPVLAAHRKVIVKPVRASLSRGLTLSIDTIEDLQKAIKTARDHHESVLVQEQIEGEEIRFIILAGKVVAALLRRTPRVTGDGKRTVAELIDEENRLRRAIDTPYVTYPELNKSIIPLEYLTSDEVLAEGEVKELNRATMIKNGCSVYNVTDSIDSSYVQLVERLAEQADIGFGCVDIFCQDYTVPAGIDNYWFMEVNTAPVLKLCYGVRDGQQVDIAPMLAQKIDDYLTASVYPPTLGIIEHVHLPALGLYRIEAKVDTGAYSGALHCGYFKVIKHKDGLKVLRFSPSDTNEFYETDRYTTTYVRSASGHRQKRYIIETDIVVRNRRYGIKIGLSDRKDMQKEILIGRRFLREHGILVDVRMNQELDNDGGGKL